MVIRSERLILYVLGLCSMTMLSGFILSSSSTFADDNDTVVDDVSITIPMACTLSGVGMNTHNATINNGTYASDIGTTTLKAYCNDNEGFAIYAIGYTDDIDGKNVLSNSTLGPDYDIVTGTLTSGNSQWAMKLTAQSNPAPTYPITIENNYNNYHTVPSNYELVAKRTAATDIGADAEGSTLTSTYQVYISENQPAGSYTGQIKYVMVHPSNTDEIPVRDDQIAVLFDGNGLTFPGGTSTNRVVYEDVCEGGYVGNTPTISKSPNLDDNGNQIGSIPANTDVYDVVTISGADKLKVVVRYDMTADYETGVSFIEEATESIDDVSGQWKSLLNEGEDSSGVKTFIIDGDVITFNTHTEESSSDDYGYYAQIYPVYNTKQTNTSYEEFPTMCSITSVSEAYIETTTWKGKWYTINNNQIVYFEDEPALLEFLEQNSDNFLGTNIELYAFNPYTIVYDGNGATAGTMNGFYTTMDTDTQYSAAVLMAYNFKKTGYGFAGWSPDQNATVNSNSKIYGPNEKIAGNELNFDNNREATLYALWVPSAGDLQGWTGCSGMNVGQVTALTDTRDNNVYTVGKLVDGRCWMMENLRLDNTATISSSNTNNPVSAFTSLSASSDSWCTQNNQSSCINQNKLNTNNINIGGTNSNSVTLSVTPGLWDPMHSDENQRVEGNNDHVQWYGYGNYYNWYSATAGNGTYSKSSGNTDGDICPNGWSLPIGGSASSTNGSFSYLDVQLRGAGGENEAISDRWRSYPNNFIYAGNWSGFTASSRGERGAYWSRTAYNSYRAYHLIVYYNVGTSPGTGYWQKYVGNSVRCLTPIPLG